MRKYLKFIIIFIVLLVLCVVISVRFFPKTYVSIFNHYSDDKVNVERLNINFFPLSLNAERLGLTSSAGESLLTVDGVTFSAQVVGWFQGKRNFWKAKLSDANVDLNKFPQSPETDVQKPNESIKTTFNLHELLGSLNFEVKNVQIKLDDQSHVIVHRLNTALKDENLFDFRLIEQGLDFSVDYFQDSESKQALRLEGKFESHYKEGFSVLDVNIPNIVFTSFYQTGVDNEGSSKDADSSEVSKVNAIEVSPETVMDWNWMSFIEPLKVNLSVGEVVINKSRVNSLVVNLTLDDMISFSQQAHVSWLESTDFSFDDQLSISGKWKPISETTRGADIRGETEVETSTLKLSVKGDVNVNGSVANTIDLSLESTALPIKTTLNQETLKLLDQYFPIKTQLNIQQLENELKVDIANATFGVSDLKGTIHLLSQSSVLSKVTTKLESSAFSYQAAQSETVAKAKPLIKEESTTVNEQFVFTKEKIDWSWLDTLALDVALDVKTLHVNDIEITNFNLPLTIQNKKLNISKVKGNFGGGSFKSSLELAEQGNDVAITANLDASKVVLEKLKLLPPEELKEGVIAVKLNVTSTGNSARDLAESLDGQVTVHLGEALLSNDSFELIGSDLILGLLNKLNPFAKKDKTTKLECAVVNLDIDKGKINIDKSLALRTSKLTVVADGYVDLNSEKIKLNLTPKSRSGVGVDASSLVKFIALGGTLAKPAPVVTASGLLKSAVVVGTAVSTGGVSLLVTNAVEKTVTKVDVCKRASDAFN